MQVVRLVEQGVVLLLLSFTAAILKFTRVQPQSKGEELLKLFLDLKQRGESILPPPTKSSTWIPNKPTRAPGSSGLSWLGMSKSKIMNTQASNGCCLIPGMLRILETASTYQLRGASTRPYMLLCNFMTFSSPSLMPRSLCASLGRRTQRTRSGP